MDNRSKLQENALRLFSDRGYDSVGVQEIVEACGVKKPTLYHYFGSKLGLLESIFQEKFIKLKEKVLQAANYQHDITKNLIDLTKVFFYYANDNKKLYRMQLTMYFFPPENEAHKIAIKYNSELHQIFEDLFKRATVDHGNFQQRHQIYSATFLGMINTYIGLYLNEFIVFSEDLIYRIVHQFMHGIFS